VLLQRNQATLLYKHTKLNSLSAIFSLHSCREAKKKNGNYYYRIRVRVISNDTNSGVGTAAEEEEEDDDDDWSLVPFE
jgi:hypothetical protein